MSDRTAVVANAIMSIIQTHLRQGKSRDLAAMRDEIAEALREEFHDVQRQTHDEINPSD